MDTLVVVMELNFSVDFFKLWQWCMAVIIRNLKSTVLARRLSSRGVGRRNCFVNMVKTTTPQKISVDTQFLLGLSQIEFATCNF